MNTRVTAYQLIQYASQGLYVLIFALALVRTLRRPRATAIDITLLFGALALVILATWLFGALDFTPPRAVAVIEGILVLSVPYILLRLVERFIGAPRWILVAALLGLALSGVALAAFESPAPRGVTLALIAYFVILTLYVAVQFVNAARSTVGVTSQRMRAVALGTIFLTLTFFIAGVQAAVPDWLPVLQILSGLAFLLSGVAYYVGFTPPAWIRTAWQQTELISFMERSMEAAEQADIDHLVSALESGVGMTLGVPSSFVAVWNPEEETLEIRSATPVQASSPELQRNMPGISVEGGVVRSSPELGLIGRCFRQQASIYSEQPAKDAPEFAEAYRESGAKSVMMAPMTVAGERFGVLGAYTSRPPLFADDDLQVLEFMARHAATVFRGRSLLERVSLLTARQELAQFKDAFLASVTHDLKTPITSIRGVAQWVRRRAGRETAVEGATLERDMQRIESASDKMTGLVNQLLDVSRIQMGRPIELARSPTDLIALVREVAEEHQGMTSRHTIKVESERGEIVGAWDGVRIERALSNLVDNAVKYSPEGGEVLVRVTVEGPTDHQIGAVHVSDHGIGIPNEDLPRIFDRFERGGNASRLGIPGTGIGLAYVLEVVDAHGGRVTVESSEGQGATFSVLLPLEVGSDGWLASRPRSHPEGTIPK
jgi:signal transduction histidine kinase